MSLLGIAMAGWLVFGTLAEIAVRIRLFKVDFATSLRRLVNIPRAAWGMTFAHAGLGLAIAGMIGSTVWDQESIQVMRPGESVTLAGYEYVFHGVRQAPGPNYTATVGGFEVLKDGERYVLLYPENRVYPVQGRPTTEAAIETTLFADLYVALGNPDKDTGGFVTRIYHKPLVLWLWVGSLMLVIGSIISLSDRKHRIGAPTKSRAGKTSGKAAAAPAE
ncbi:cytochrome c-type biogenesis CcmF C-terminal domain-containing protein [Pseudomonadota bacterium]